MLRSPATLSWTLPWAFRWMTSASRSIDSASGYFARAMSVALKSLSASPTLASSPPSRPRRMSSASPLARFRGGEFAAILVQDGERQEALRDGEVRLAVESLPQRQRLLEERLGALLQPQPLVDPADDQRERRLRLGLVLELGHRARGALVQDLPRRQRLPAGLAGIGPGEHLLEQARELQALSRSARISSR